MCSSDLGGFAADLVRQAGCGICIESENETELADAVEKLATDPDLRSRLGRQGRESLAVRYDMNRLAEDYAGIVERVRQEWLGGRS